MHNSTAGAPTPSPTGTVREPINVAIVDQIPLFREGLASRIMRDPGMRLVGVTGHLNAAIQLRARQAVDVLVVDSLLDPHGQLATLLTRSNPGLAVVGMVRDPYRTAQFVSTALAAGMRGLVLKSSTPEQVLEAIRRSHHDGRYIDPALAPLVAGSVQPSGGGGRPLTHREYQVLQLIADGLSNQGVADALVVSVETVRTHIKSVLRKLDARDRAHAVARGFRAGLLAPQCDRPQAVPLRQSATRPGVVPPGSVPPGSVPPARVPAERYPAYR